MNQIDNIMALADVYATQRQHAHYQHETDARQALRAVIEQALTPGEPDPLCDDVRLAEMILSDCGHSTNNTRLLERVTNRIARHAAAQPQPKQEPVAWQGVYDPTDLYWRKPPQTDVRPLYTAPQPTKRVPLTREHVPPNNDLELLLRQVFAFCEATEDATEVEPKNEHQRGFDKGRRFEAKQIRRSIGDWFQAEFCGRSFMGEPVVAAALEAPQPAKRVPLADEEIDEIAGGRVDYFDRHVFARAIEAAHGIGEQE